LRKAAFIYKEELTRAIFSEEHVLKPSRLQYTYELLDSYHAFEDPTSLVVPPGEAGEEELLSFHTREYIEAVRSISNGETRFNPAAFNFSPYGDNPPYPGMYEAALRPVGASLTAARMVADGEVDVAFNASGGLHHAAPNHASGFCIFNDPVIAIKYLLKRGMRVAYIDIDAHHGDGVQDAFYSSDQVLTISLHEWGRYLFPGTGDPDEIGTGAGMGYSVNLPFYPYTDDETYLWAFREVVPPLVRSFNPDIVVSQLGADSHYRDPLTHLALTTEGYTEVIKEIGKLAPRWLALGGGGYAQDAVPRMWTLAYGVMVGREWPDEIPYEYQERYGIKRLRDAERPRIDDATKDRVRRFAQATVEEVKRRVFPFHHLL